MPKLTTLIALLSLALTSGAQDIRRHYKIYDVKNAREITQDELTKAASSADVLFFGEEHNDSIGHRLEDEIFRKLTELNPGRMALSLEMFHTDVQPVMNEYLAGLIAEKNLVAEGRAWKNYKDYRDMVEHAKSSGLAVIAANAGTRYTNAVTRSGLDILQKLPAASRAYLPPLPIDTAIGAYSKKFSDLLGGHMGSMKIYQSQNLWDATMAWSISSYLKKNKQEKIFHVNGRFHTDEKLGTFAQLKKYAPKLNAMNISCFYDPSFPSPDWTRFSHLGDFIIITDPNVKRSF